MPSQDSESESGTSILSLGAATAGTRLDRFLVAELRVSRAQARRLLARGAISLEGRRLGYADKGMPLPASGRLAVAGSGSPQDERALPGERGAVAILAEGPGWIAVDKPAGWPVHPLAEGESGTVLGAVLAERSEVQGVGEGGLRSGVLHRLDTDTSGVLLFATSQPQWDRLREAFRSHRVAKRYRAIVAGDLRVEADREMEFDVAVARHRPAHVRVLDGSWGRSKRAYRVRQRVEVLERLSGATLVEVRIVTGFLHQIRVTLAHLGHPIVGDALYGDEAALALAAPRQLLHAAHLSFEEVEAASPDPRDFSAALRQLRFADESVAREDGT